MRQFAEVSRQAARMPPASQVALGPVVTELTADDATQAVGPRVDVDVVVAGVGADGGDERRVRERARPDHAVLIAGWERQRLNDWSRNARRSDVNVRAERRSRQVGRDA